MKNFFKNLFTKQMEPKLYALVFQTEDSEYDSLYLWHGVAYSLDEAIIQSGLKHGRKFLLKNVKVSSVLDINSLADLLFKNEIKIALPDQPITTLPNIQNHINELMFEIISKQDRTLLEEQKHNFTEQELTYLEEKLK